MRHESSLGLFGGSVTALPFERSAELHNITIYGGTSLHAPAASYAMSICLSPTPTHLLLGDMHTACYRQSTLTPGLCKPCPQCRNYGWDCSSGGQWNTSRVNPTCSAGPCRYHTPSITQVIVYWARHCAHWHTGYHP